MAFVVALWVFIVFFFDGILSHLAEQKLIDLVATATHNEYQLSFRTFEYHRGTVDATGLDLRRVAYRANEYGTTLRNLGISDTRVTGISWWEVIFGNPITLWMARTYEPRAYLCNFAQDRDQWKLLPPYIPIKSAPSNFSLKFDSVLIPGIWIYGQEGTTDKSAGVISFTCQNLLYNARSTAPMNLTEDHVRLEVPWLQYADSGTRYLVRNALLTSTDSMFKVDTFAYVSGSGPTQIRASGFRADVINFDRALAGEGIAAHKVQADTWGVTFAADTTHPNNQPKGISWQDQLARSVGIPIHIDSLMLNRGDLDIYLAHASMVGAHGLDLHMAAIDFDTGAAAHRPGFSQAFDLDAHTARYATGGMAIALTNFHGNIQDSLLTAGSVEYASAQTARRNRTRPMQFRDVRATDVGFAELLAGKAILARSLVARGWNVSGLPVQSAPSTKHSANANTRMASLYASQESIARSVGIPIRIGKIDLTGGRVNISGRSAPTIYANGASIDAVDVRVDSSTAASHRLLFSKDVNVGATKFHFADVGRYNLVDLDRVHTRLSRRAVSARAVSYTNRSKFEPQLNNATYHLKDMDLTGIDFTGLLDNKRIALGTLKASSWAIDRSSDTTTQPPSSTAPAAQSKSSWNIPITLRQAILPDGTVIFRERDTTPSGFSPTLQSKIATLEVAGFRFLPPKGKRPRLGYDQVICAVPSFTYAPLDGFYAARIRNLNANLKDSLITMDSLGYEPKYSEDEFTALHQYARGRTDFRLANVKIVDIDARRLINGGGVVIDQFIVPSMWMDYYKDTRKPVDPHPSPAVMPNDIVRSLHLPLTVRYIDIQKGHIQIREKTQPGVAPGDFTFDSVSLDAEPITFDTTSPYVDSTTRFDLAGYLIGQSPTRVTILYPLHDSELNLGIRGTVGPFDLTALNQYVVNADRIQVKSGNFYHADVDMTVRHDIATTYVAPIYNHFKIRILDTEPGTPGLGHRLETFIANTFVLREDNPDEDGGPPVTATTSLTRTQSEEFFQFLWFAIRQSLGTVVGGFK